MTYKLTRRIEYTAWTKDEFETAAWTQLDLRRRRYQ